MFAGCFHSDADDVVGPFTGETRRFVVDSIELPRNNTVAREYGGDLNGDHTADNQLGMVVSVLAGQGDVTDHAADMIAAGALATSVEIRADDFTNDPTVSVLYLGADGDTGTAVGGVLRDGVFLSNRTATSRVLGRARLRVPLFVDADPISVDLIGVEMELHADAAGGFDGFVRGAVENPAAAAFPGLVQMMAYDPYGHLGLLRLLDDSRDYAISFREFATNEVIQALLASDLELDGRPVVSFGFRVHLKPCASGRCAAAPAADTCHDRVRDGDETDVDCGGGCGACIGSAGCAIGSDCKSGACDAGACRAASCEDGVRDGLETDVDCGGGCGPCARGRRCWVNGDCASGNCGQRCNGDGCRFDTLDTCRS